MAQLKLKEAVNHELQEPGADSLNGTSLLIIEGVRENGAVFRPSDWSERLSSTFGEFGKDQRLHYYPGVYPRVFNGTKALALEVSLQWQNPEIFKAVIKFARDNNLRISELIV